MKWFYLVLFCIQMLCVFYAIYYNKPYSVIIFCVWVALFELYFFWFYP